MPSPLISDLRKALGRENVLSAASELAVYDCDALTIERRRPEAVVFPRSTQQVAEVAKVCGRHGVAITARGAGTSLAGGCVPSGGADIPVCREPDIPVHQRADKNVCPTVVVMLTRMNRILEIDLRNRMAVVEAGVCNLRLTQALAGTGYHFAPDPSSQGASTIGGNVATNAGGPHTLKYGVTVNHVLGVEAVLHDGSILQLGGKRGQVQFVRSTLQAVANGDSPPFPAQLGGKRGQVQFVRSTLRAVPANWTCPLFPPLDLIGVLVGSEGTLGIVTKVWVRLTANPQDCRAMRATFNSLDDASNAVSQIIAAGIIPAAMELMDQVILSAVEEAYQFGFPPDAGAVLVVEVDGPAVGLDRQQERIVEFCKRFGAREVLQAASAQERELLWKCRKMAVGATGRLSPSYTLQDGVVPRTRLPHIIRRTAEIGKKHDIRIVNVAHAGDGNVHPILLFDERDRGQVERAQAAGREILEECIACGGSITAEHGIGIEKIALMDRFFAPADLEAMRRVREAFDPTGRLNPGKLIPSSRHTPCAVADGTRNVPATADGTRRVPATLDRVIDYPADDMTITVGAGMTIAELNKLLAEKRQWLPVDVPWPDLATVGEAIATDAAGPRRYAYGAMRDYLLGFTAVDGTGMTFSGGGRVAKNAAGYNMCRLMAGSRGTLATIIQATLMVRPLPEASALLACEVQDFGMAERLLASLVRSAVRPVAVEFSAGRSHENNPLFGPVLESNVGRLCVGFEGSAVEVEWMLGRLREEWTSLGMTSPVLMPNLATDRLWRWIAEFPADVRIDVLPSKLIETITEALKIAPNCAIQAHAGDGVIHICSNTDSHSNSRGLTAPGETGETEETRETTAALRGLLAPGYCRDDAADHSEPELRVMQAIKERFDPMNVLNPER